MSRFAVKCPVCEHPNTFLGLNRLAGNAAVSLALLWGGYEFTQHGPAGLGGALPWIALAVVYRIAVGVVFTIYREN